MRHAQEMGCVHGSTVPSISVHAGRAGRVHASPLRSGGQSQRPSGS